MLIQRAFLIACERYLKKYISSDRNGRKIIDYDNLASDEIRNRINFVIKLYYYKEAL
jgi:hypothetical protein